MAVCPQCNNTVDSDLIYCPNDGARIAASPSTAGDSAAFDGAHPDALPEGHELGGYRIISLIGSGGMGNVYLAEHIRLGRLVALKILHSQYAADAKACERFFNEARAVNQIAHENIVQITDFFDQEGSAKYYVMELLEGPTLEDVQAKTNPLPLRRALEIMRQVAAALYAVHNAGIIHRDLKPANIVLTKRGAEDDFVKLLDFGVAKVTDMQTGESLQQTAAYAILGTPEYMSPEQVSGIEIDHRSDVYAFGIILYELISGRKPFSGNSYGEFVIKHTTVMPIPISELDNLGQWVPAGVEKIVLDCLEKEIDNRPANMKLVEERILDCLDELPEDAASQKPRRRLFSRGTRKKLRIALPAAAVLVAATAFALTYEPPVKEVIQAAQPATIDVAFNSEPPGADVFRAGLSKPIGQTPFTIQFKRSPNSETFEFRLKDHTSASLDVSLSDNSQVSMTLAKIKKAPPKAPRPRATAPRAKPKKKKVDKSGVIDPFAD